MKPSRLASFCLLLSTSASSVVFSAGLDSSRVARSTFSEPVFHDRNLQYLVARWTFNEPVVHDQNLQSDVGSHKFRQIRVGNNPSDYTFDNGTMTMGPGCLLVCESLSSETSPLLANSVTIWARLRLEQRPKFDCFAFGLRATPQPGDWDDMVFVALHRAEPQNASGFSARFLDRDSQLSSGSRYQFIEPARWVTVALVFNGTERKVTYIVDGNVVSGMHHDATSLAPFSNFALGRLKEAGGNPSISFDEVRIYSVALTPEWVLEIAPIPEEVQ